MRSTCILHLWFQWIFLKSHQNVMNYGNALFYVCFLRTSTHRMLKQFVKFNDILHFCHSSFNSFMVKFLLLFFFFFFLFICLFSFSPIHFLNSEEVFHSSLRICPSSFLKMTHYFNDAKRAIRNDCHEYV